MSSKMWGPFDVVMLSVGEKVEKKRSRVVFR